MKKTKTKGVAGHGAALEDFGDAGRDEDGSEAAR